MNDSGRIAGAGAKIGAGGFSVLCFQNQCEKDAKILLVTLNCKVSRSEMEVLLIIIAFVAFLIYKFQNSKAHFKHQDEIHAKAAAEGATVPALQTLTQKELKEVTEWFGDYIPCKHDRIVA